MFSIARDYKCYETSSLIYDSFGRPNKQKKTRLEIEKEKQEHYLEYRRQWQKKHKKKTRSPRKDYVQYDGKTMAEHSELIGRDYTFFSQLKAANKTKFDLINEKWNGNLSLGFQEFPNYAEDVCRRFLNACNVVKRHKKIMTMKNFSREIFGDEKKLHKIAQNAKRFDGDMRVSTLNMLEETIEKIKEYYGQVE